MPMDQSALMMAAGCADADTAEQKLQKLGAYAAKMAEERDAAALARKKMEDDAKAKSPAAEAAPLAGAETPAEEKAEKLVQQAMERRLKTAEEAAAKAQTLADKLEAERQGERVQAFSRWALAGPVEEGGSRWPKEDEKGLHELIKDMGGDLDNFAPAIDYFQKLAKNAPIVPKQTAYARVLSGELPILVDYDFNAIKHTLAQEIAADPAKVDAALDLLMVIKYLERIGDHAVNVAEWVQFVRTGRYKDESMF